MCSEELNYNNSHYTVITRATLFECCTAECLDTICNLQEEGATQMLLVRMEFMLFRTKSWMF